MSDEVAGLLERQADERQRREAYVRRMEHMRDTAPPGTIGVLGADLSRYSEFTLSLCGVIAHLPVGSNLRYTRGVDISGNCNDVIRDMVGEWVWIMGDDHVFEQDILLRLLEHDVDVVVPHCLKRVPVQAGNTHYWPSVVYGGQIEDRYRSYYSADLPQEGLTEIHAAGSAGMLIKKHVLDALDDPWFRPAPDAEGLNEDLYFCQQVREAGFKIHCDPTIGLGHIANYTVWPMWKGDEWGWQTVWEFGPGCTYNPPPVRLATPELSEAEKEEAVA